MPKHGEIESPLVYNLRRVDEIIAEMQAPFRQAIAEGDGSEPHHSDEVRKLDSARARMRYDLTGLGIADPVDEGFVRSMIKLLDVEYVDGQSAGQDLIGWQRRGELIDKAFEESKSEAA